ncbi:MAG: hypothetical protein JO199_05390 [Candidatus Eremiobacteraeota bacterium]|nr:hypothetical protein [Candidatus Eremiobacteraeota bacterium]
MFAQAFAALALAGSLSGSATADFGVEVPTLGIVFKSWPSTYERYFSPSIMDDIAHRLGATYVRTGWIPDWYRPGRPWVREDQALDSICGAGLHVMIIVPGPGDDKRGLDDLLQNVRDFFTHVTAREPGCLRYAEIANEADLPINGFPDARAYAAYYARVAPIVASFGLPVISAGVSGADAPWVRDFADATRVLRPQPPLAGIGFHPYGVTPARLESSVNALAAQAGSVAGGTPTPVYVTEIGRADPVALYDTIVALAHLTPALTVYEYRAQPNDDGASAKYALRDNPALYDAARRAFAASRSDVTGRRSVSRRCRWPS